MIAIGSDHGGFALKAEIIDHLQKRGFEVKDFGTYSEASCDYPVYAKAVAKAVAAGECEKGILICGTGIGVSITANKFRGIRAALCTSSRWARASRDPVSRLRSSTPSWIRRFPAMRDISAASL